MSTPVWLNALEAWGARAFRPFLQPWTGDLARRTTTHMLARTRQAHIVGERIKQGHRAPRELITVVLPFIPVATDASRHARAGT